MIGGLRLRLILLRQQIRRLPLVPSPLAGEGSRKNPRAQLGEGFSSQEAFFAKRPPHPIQVCRYTLLPSPARGEGTVMSAQPSDSVRLIRPTTLSARRSPFISIAPFEQECSLISSRTIPTQFSFATTAPLSTPAQNYVHGIVPVESAAAVALRARDAPTTRRAINAHQLIARSFRLTIRFSMPPSLCPVRVRVLSRGIAMAGRDAASRAFADASKPREAPETRPPPLRADARSSQTVKPSRFIPRGTGPTIAAVERREASVPAGTQGVR